MKRLLLMLIASSASSAWACSFSERVCDYDDEFYRYEIHGFKSSLPADVLKVTIKQGHSGSRPFSKMIFENVSERPIYYLQEEPYDFPRFKKGGKFWAPYKMVKGTPATCILDTEKSPKELDADNLESQVVWMCQEINDTCGGSDNEHPLERRIYAEDYRQSGLDSASRKIPPTTRNKDIYNFMYNGRLETVEVEWSTHLNDKYLSANCDKVSSVSKCGDGCVRGRRVLEYAKDYGWKKPFKFELDGYKVEVKPPRFPDKSWDKEIGLPVERTKKEIADALSFVKARAEGSPVPLDIVAIEIVNKLAYGPRVFEVKVQHTK